MLKYSDLVIFKSLETGPVKIEKKRIRTPYLLTLSDRSMVRNEFIYSYEENTFDPNDPVDINLASMMSVQIAVNYGLFCEELIFNGCFDGVDRQYLKQIIENTSREILVNKFLFPNEFIVEPYNLLTPEKRKRYSNADLVFNGDESKQSWDFPDTDPQKAVILSSGGKDSLTTTGLMREMGYDVHPVFINESGRHWFTAVNAYRYFHETERNTVRVWCNSDRIFNWIVKQMPMVRKDFASVRADIYPIRLWTVAVFLFGVLPLALKRGAGNILIGNEYDCTMKGNYHGITHYNALYDQSKYFDNAFTRYYHRKGIQLYQYSILRSLSELLIEKVLAERYPHLLKHQISCHAAHEKEGRMHPCGKCEKCRRIVGMLSALGKDATTCGYSRDQVGKALTAFGTKKIKQIGSDAAHLYHMLLSIGAIPRNEQTTHLAKSNNFTMKLRFDKERSNFVDMPQELRIPLIKIFLEHADGTVVMENRHWKDIDILKSNQIEQEYKFNIPRE